MEQTTYAGRFRYLDAHDCDDAVVDFDGLEVRGHDDRKLGDIDGFIVDATTGRVYYVVVDSGGWFSSRRFLLPIGHATVDRERGALRVDVGQEALKQYPDFDEARFREFSDEDLRAFEQRMASACCPEDAAEDTGAWHYDTRRHYTQPEWWGSGTYPRERLRPVEAGVSGPRPAGERFDRERLAAREQGEVSGRGGDDVSPHLDGRAQPGDVLGIETGGERTYVGDTAEEENERRRAAERKA